MEDRTLDKQIAAALGYETLEAEDSVFGPALYIHDTTATRDGTNHRVIGASWERLKVGGAIAEYCVRLCPAWAENHEHARELEDEIERRGLQSDYVWALAELLFVDGDEWGTAHVMKMMRATPEQRARAFLVAVR